MPFRFALDIGTSSIGWAIIDLDDAGNAQGVRRAGVRIFSDGRNPKSGASLAVDRRQARQARRQRDRFLRRRSALMDALIALELMPSGEAERKRLESLDPYELRARALDGPLTSSELGRALFHINQRRGFKSNRKTDRGAADERGIVKKSITDLRRRVDQSKSRTLGEYLHRRRKKGKSTRREYTDRSMLEEEARAVLVSQLRFIKSLTEEQIEKLLDLMFYQRPLRPVRPGRCTLDPSEERAAWAHPNAQNFRIYQELNNLRIARAGASDVPLAPDQRDALHRMLRRQKNVTFDSMRKQLGLPPEARFNLEWENRKFILGDQTAWVLSRKDCFGSRWHDLSEEEQASIVSTLLEDESEERVLSRATSAWGLEEQAAERVANTTLPVGYARLGLGAISKLVPIMRDQGLMYSDAAEEAGFHHSDFRPGELVDRLPYYGEVLERYVGFGSGNPKDSPEARFGRIANPTVHVGLNQLRKLTNAVMESYGRPDQVVIELARDLKMSRDSKIEHNRRSLENQKRNKRIAGEIEKLGEAVNRQNLDRWKLWEELGDVHDRRCPFTGRQISTSMLFSSQVEVEHLLPFSRTLDDSMSNKTLCLIEANRAKGNRSPHEAFGGNSVSGFDWDAISERASSLPFNKRWRFSPDAMKRFDGEGGFLARQLNDTSYLSRIAKQYLGTVCRDVRSTPGRLTALLRRRWGLNSILSKDNIKNRNDHRQHAVDAVVVGVTDLGVLQRISRASESSREEVEIPDPWDGFRSEVQEVVLGIVVSHKPDRGSRAAGQTSGQLHNDTAYGVLEGPDSSGFYVVTYRKEVANLSLAEIGKIADPALRLDLQRTLTDATARNEKHKETLQSWSAANNVKRIRLRDRQRDVIGIRDRAGRVYKAFKGDSNDHAAIYQRPDGNWGGEVVSTFDAHQATDVPRWVRENPGSKLKMKLYKNDMVAIQEDGALRILRVVKFSGANKNITFCEHNEGGALKTRHDSPDDPFRYLSKAFSRLGGLRCRKISVDLLGAVRGLDGVR